MSNKPNIYFPVNNDINSNIIQRLNLINNKINFRKKHKELIYIYISQ